MIAILLNDASFEQDIRELLMAFYPGETFTHKEEEAGEADLIVRGVRDGNSFSLDVTPVKKDAVHFALIYPDFSNRFETKNEIKQTLYRLLSARPAESFRGGRLPASVRRRLRSRSCMMAGRTSRSRPICARRISPARKRSI